MSRLSKDTFTIGQTQYSTQRRRITKRRLNDTGATFISPSERWADSNYAPYELDYVYHQNTETSEIIAPLHGFREQDVHVAITRGHVIILLADDEDTALFSRQEFYCEVPLPPDVNQNDAFIEIDTHFVTIHLIRRQLIFQRVVSAVRRCHNSFAVLTGRSWNLGRLDD
jgi:HSP20 family molecular chaperone IbpA